MPLAVGVPVAGPGSRANSGWSVRLSPKAAGERERRLKQRLAELPALIDEIVVQVHEQRRAVSDRGTSRQAIRAAAEQTVPADLQSATSLMSDLLGAKRLAEAAALVLRATEEFPGETSAELACRAGEASRQAKEGELAVLCFTTAVLAAPPCEAACWQLAGMALEQRDSRLAPIWMEFLARLLRVRGADEDSVVVYRQLLNLTPRRQDVRDILRVASLTGTLPD
ncbi:MAG: tetratricopeptide repeat protein [Candidatus Dormibacteria bacterium]